MSEEHEANGFDDFLERFEALADEAQRYGVNACVVLQSEDPLSRETRLSETIHGGRMRAIGMLQQALWHLEKTA